MDDQAKFATLRAEIDDRNRRRLEMLRQEKRFVKWLLKAYAASLTKAGGILDIPAAEGANFSAGNLIGKYETHEAKRSADDGHTAKNSRKD